MKQKRWTLKKAPPDIVSELEATLKIHPVLCQLLCQRGITDYDQAKTFFRTKQEDLHDPFLMKGMQKAVQRIHQALQQKERIMIYGDYDVDGTTAVAVVYQYFKQLTDHIVYYIPHRFTEGYGVSEKGIQEAIEQNIKLIITLDCGIKSNQLIDLANAHHIDTIVCDHHLPDTDLPNALAILNPKQPDCPYPYKDLCGCGIGFKLITAFALYQNLNIEDCFTLLDLVATAIAADIVPVTGENRTLSVLGLAKANNKPSIPIRALKNISNLDRPFTITDLVFVIAPRVNAAGRMDNAKKAVELFIETDLQKAIALASILQDDNNDRRDIDKLITDQAKDLIQDTDGQFSTVLYNPDWHKGVVGIVASRLIDIQYRPTIVLTCSNGKITGSARSIKGFNLFEGLNQCADFLENYGGHYFAAGLTLTPENLPGFKKRFNEVVGQTLTAEHFQPEIEVDAELQFNDITPSFLNILDQFAPHGPENMKPVFLSRGVMNHKQLSNIVKEKHVRFVVHQQGSQTMNGIGFNLAEKFHLLQHQESIDILYHLEENNYQGLKSIQLKVIDLR